MMNYLLHTLTSQVPQFTIFILSADGLEPQVPSFTINLKGDESIHHHQAGCKPRHQKILCLCVNTSTCSTGFQTWQLQQDMCQYMISGSVCISLVSIGLIAMAIWVKLLFIFNPKCPLVANCGARKCWKSNEFHVFTDSYVCKNSLQSLLCFLADMKDLWWQC